MQTQDGVSHAFAAEGNYMLPSCIPYMYTHCNTLQHTATHCNTLQHTATHCNTLQHTATHITCCRLVSIRTCRPQFKTWVRSLSESHMHPSCPPFPLVRFPFLSFDTLFPPLHAVRCVTSVCSRGEWQGRYSQKSAGGEIYWTQYSIELTFFQKQNVDFADHIPMRVDTRHTHVTYATHTIKRSISPTIS